MEDFNKTNFAESLNDVLDNVYFALLKKNDSYGASAFRPPVLCPALPPKVGILTRMSDKINRLYSGGKIEGETFDDTILDLVGYGVLYLVAQNMEKKTEEETEEEGDSENE